MTKYVILVIFRTFREGVCGTTSPTKGKEAWETARTRRIGPGDTYVDGDGQWYGTMYPGTAPDHIDNATRGYHMAHDGVYGSGTNGPLFGIFSRPPGVQTCAHG